MELNTSLSSEQAVASPTETLASPSKEKLDSAIARSQAARQRLQESLISREAKDAISIVDKLLSEEGRPDSDTAQQALRGSTLWVRLASQVLEISNN